MSIVPNEPELQSRNSRGLEAYFNGEDLSKYTPTGRDTYESGLESGRGAVPSLIEVAALLLAVPTDGASLEAEVALTGAEAESAAAATSNEILGPARADQFVLRSGKETLETDEVMLTGE